MTPGTAEPGVKAFRTGTHRAVPPEQTLERVMRWAPVMGITRVANVTGLDRIGLPVVMVCRPNARSLSVSQGKGLDLAAARASGLMEAIELYHAERITQPLKLASFNELRFTHPLAEVSALPRLSTSLFHDDLQLLWIEGHDLLGDTAVWVPYEMVHMNLTLPLAPGSGCFAASSNGLASGNHPLEALSHALCEVIERDANALWLARPPGVQQRTRVDLATVDDPACREALDLYERAGIAVAVWDLTSDLGVPAFRCTILDRDPDPFHPLFAGAGLGCHPAREVALLRALTEAAQTRLTSIAGSRDDLRLEHYERLRDADEAQRIAEDVEPTGPLRGFCEAPTRESETFAEDVGWLLERLAEAGMRQAVAVDLTHPAFGVPVVHVVVPGLETDADLTGYLPGPRARAAATSDELS